MNVNIKTIQYMKHYSHKKINTLEWLPPILNQVIQFLCLQKLGYSLTQPILHNIGILENISSWNILEIFEVLWRGGGVWNVKQNIHAIWSRVMIIVYETLTFCITYISLLFWATLTPYIKRWHYNSCEPDWIVIYQEKHCT